MSETIPFWAVLVCFALACLVMRRGKPSPHATYYGAKVQALLRYHEPNRLGSCEGEGGECGICAILDCPENDPLHYHHDGCPSCSPPTF